LIASNADSISSDRRISRVVTFCIRLDKAYDRAKCRPGNDLAYRFPPIVEALSRPTLTAEVAEFKRELDIG
jgi:hypothetical protein